MNQTVLDVLLILHFVGLMMGAGGGLGSTLVMGYALSLPPEQQGVVRGVGPRLASMALGGTALLWVTGPAMVAWKYDGFGAMPAMFWVKLVFAGILLLAGIAIHLTYARVKKGDVKAAALLPKLGPVAGISALLAVIFAGLAFH